MTSTFLYMIMKKSLVLITWTLMIILIITNKFVIKAWEEMILLLGYKHLAEGVEIEEEEDRSLTLLKGCHKTHHFQQNWEISYWLIEKLMRHHHHIQLSI